MKKKKLVAVVLTFSMVVASLTACGRKDKEKDVKPTSVPINTEVVATPVPTIVPVRDLGGINIIVGDWWTDPEAETVLDQKGEDQLAYRE